MWRSIILFLKFIVINADESSTLWENLRDEIQDPKDALQTSSDDDSNENGMFPEPGTFFLHRGFPNKDLISLHPSPVDIFRMWQTFLVNVNPLVKIFHAPTVQQVILDATGDLAHVPKATESLMFAIYLLSITSLKPEDCETMFGETRAALVSKYSQAAQQALVNGKFLKSIKLCSLQAFALYLVSYPLHPLGLACTLPTIARRIQKRTVYPTQSILDFQSFCYDQRLMLTYVACPSKRL